jgi:hypothetical protein
LDGVDRHLLQVGDLPKFQTRFETQRNDFALFRRQLPHRFANLLHLLIQDRPLIGSRARTHLHDWRLKQRLAALSGPTPERSGAIDQARDQVVPHVATDADPIVGLDQLEEHVLDHVLGLANVACQEDRQLEQIAPVLVVELPQGVDVGASQSPDKPLIVQHSVP